MAGRIRGAMWRAFEKLAGPSPYQEIGVGGTAIFGGYPAHDQTKPNLYGVHRWRKAHEILADVSIVAASLRYFLNLVARPSWKATPPNDKPDAKAVAEFIESVIAGTDTSWARMVRRQGMYRFHGFGIHEWTAKKRDDGKIGLASVEVRPGQTIERWDLDENGSVRGVWQRAPMTGQAIYLPRAKIMYLVDDVFTDDPMGMGWFRHVLEPSELLRNYLRLEKIGFQRDLSGIPIGRAPISALNKQIGIMDVPDGNGGTRKLTRADVDGMMQGLKEFVGVKSKNEDTGLLLDSQPFVAKSENGTTISSTLQWGLELLTGEAKSIVALGEAIRRLVFDIALIIGTENILTGREGKGSYALSEDKSRNLYMNVNSTTGEMAEVATKDIVGPICDLNGIPEELRPKLTCEDASFKDVQQIATVLQSMAQAGAVLQPNDPAINDVRDLLDIQHAPEMDPELTGAVTDGGKGNDPNELPDHPSQGGGTRGSGAGDY